MCIIAILQYVLDVPVLQFENFDLQSIVTPVKAEILKDLLQQSGYDQLKTNFLYDGFLHGFSLQYNGPKKVKRLAPNLKLRVGSQLELWNKIMCKIKALRYAGPFDKVPFNYFIQSPVGLVPKDRGTKTRLIFHLSFPKRGDSVNSGIDHQDCTVRYPEFSEAIDLCIRTGKSRHITKSDMSMAFRHVPLARTTWFLLVLKAKHPVTGVTYFFLDKCLPFGSSISCRIFQEFSNAVAHLVTARTRELLVNYLDDYLFAALVKAMCDGQVRVFLDICDSIKFPVSLEKTFWGTQ